MILEPKKRPLGITALSIFFMSGSVICLVASLGLEDHEGGKTILLFERQPELPEATPESPAHG